MDGVEGLEKTTYFPKVRLLLSFVSAAECNQWITGEEKELEEYREYSEEDDLFDCEPVFEDYRVQGNQARAEQPHDDRGDQVIAEPSAHRL